MIKYAQRSVLLTTLLGERFEYEGIKPAPKEYKNDNDLLQGENTKDSKVDCEFSDVSIEEQTPLEDLNVRIGHAYVD